MKTLRIFLGAGMAVAMLGFLDVATADVRNDSIKTPKFTVDAGDGSIGLPDISFDTMGGSGTEETQTTCAMTPGGNMQGLLLEQPFTPPPTPERLTTTPDDALAPISSLQTPPSYNPNRNYPIGWNPNNPNNPNDPYDPNDPGGPGGPTTPGEPSVVPEPATLVIIGFGIAGIVVAHRRRKTPSH